MISAVSPEGIPEEERPDLGLRDADPEAMDTRLLEAVGFEAHPDLPAGHRWAGGAGVEDLHAPTLAEVTAAVRGISSKSKGETIIKGGGE